MNRNEAKQYVAATDDERKALDAERDKQMLDDINRLTAEMGAATTHKDYAKLSRQEWQDAMSVTMMARAIACEIRTRVEFGPHVENKYALGEFRLAPAFLPESHCEKAYNLLHDGALVFSQKRKGEWKEPDVYLKDKQVTIYPGWVTDSGGASYLALEVRTQMGEKFICAQGASFWKLIAMHMAQQAAAITEDTPDDFGDPNDEGLAHFEKQIAEDKAAAVEFIATLNRLLLGNRLELVDKAIGDMLKEDQERAVAAIVIERSHETYVKATERAQRDHHGQILKLAQAALLPPGSARDEALEDLEPWLREVRDSVKGIEDLGAAHH